MSPSEVAERKGQLISTSERMSGMLSGENLAKYQKSVADIIKAIDANDLAAADRLQTVMTASIRAAMSGSRGNGQGRNGGE